MADDEANSAMTQNGAGDGLRKTSRGAALITGASGGIGEDLARLFAADGYDLVLVARSEEKLRALADELSGAHGVGARVVARDLARPEAPREIFDELQADSVEVEFLINNAGFGSYGLFAKTDERKELELLQVNVVALTHLTKLFLPPMLARRRGRIMNVASTAAFQPGPLMAVYYASKAYVLSLSEALANETEGTGVTVTTLCPGPTHTGFVAAAGMGESKLFERGAMESRPVAEAGYRALMRGERVEIPGFMNRFMAHAVSFVPRRVVLNAVRNIQERRGD